MAKRHLTVYERELAAMHVVRLDGGYAAFNMMRGLGGNVNLTRPGGFMHRDSILWRPPKLWKEEPLEAKDIRRISVLPTRTKKLKIFSYADELLRIETGDGRVFDYLKSEEWMYFDEYKRELEKFARENNITFADVTA